MSTYIHRCNTYIHSCIHTYVRAYTHTQAYIHACILTYLPAQTPPGENKLMLSLDVVIDTAFAPPRVRPLVLSFRLARTQSVALRRPISISVCAHILHPSLSLSLSLFLSLSLSLPLSRSLSLSLSLSLHTHTHIWIWIIKLLYNTTIYSF